MKKVILVIAAATLLIVNSVSAQKEKLDKFEIFDEYDLLHIVKTQELLLDDCFGAACAAEVGKIFGVDKVLTGSVIRINEKITYTMRLIDVETRQTKKSAVIEFANQQPHIQAMTMIMVQSLLGLPIDEQLLSELTAVNEPIITTKSKLNASGPRMGIGYLTEGTTN